MADPKGDFLFVNLSASQTRKRLKRFGHGVRKIQSAGKNQALVIHTATGEHLSELERLFADVGCSSGDVDLPEPIENLRNLGSVSAGWLRASGIRTVADLQDFGPVFAYEQVKRSHQNASLNLLWALAAGLQGKDWRDLTDAEKNKLLEEMR
ncbi:TfoX/Sxy family protein [Roseiconus nitratireducens]|uniref:TfoX/Sxy family protein n=1 Tax=Roseiconus nitratireducens TaxID=2605748 RepID=A0A5M6D3S5_9BACT|nr:TfoX/Sxy family protein [Roseiconus nitratireducens]KAA5542141.1 TfoX/Sxy family protein [Roseiconus nitratireducens]